MDPELRVVFILYELEEMATAEIAVLIDVPAGTVGSRLFRARKEFEDPLEISGQGWAFAANHFPGSSTFRNDGKSTTAPRGTLIVPCRRLRCDER